jgi:hypothetical protein
MGPSARSMYAMQVSDLTDALKTADSDVLIEVRSATNVLRGQPLILKFALVGNRIVFHRGSVIETDSAPAGMSHDDADRFLKSLLQKTRSKARAQGMIPNGTTRTVVSASDIRFEETVSAITNNAHAQTVSIHAVDDTRIADNLMVDFTVSD